MAKSALKVQPIQGPTLMVRPLNKKEADARRKDLIDVTTPPIAGSLLILEDDEAHEKACEFAALSKRRSELMAPIRAELATIEEEESRLKLYFAERGGAAETIGFINLPLTIDRSLTEKVMAYREAALRGVNKL